MRHPPRRLLPVDLDRPHRLLPWAGDQASVALQDARHSADLSIVGSELRDIAVTERHTHLIEEAELEDARRKKYAASRPHLGLGRGDHHHIADPVARWRRSRRSRAKPPIAVGGAI